MKKINNYINETLLNKISFPNCKTEEIKNIKFKHVLSNLDLTKFDDNYIYDVYINDEETIRLVKKDFAEENRDYAIFFVRDNDTTYNVNIVITNAYYDSFMENDYNEVKNAISELQNIVK